MPKTFKILLILLVVVTISSAGLTIAAFIGKNREYTKRVLLEDKLAATLKDKRRLENEKKEIQLRIVDIEAKMEEVSSQVREEKNKNRLMSDDLSAREREIARLKEGLEKEKKERRNISKRLEDLKLDYEKVRTESSRIRNEKVRLEKRLFDLKERSVDLDTIVVRPTEPLRGTVLVVNRDYSFVVTDLGKDDGIKKGMIFEIRDGTRFLGTAEIDRIYDTMSSATLMPDGKINSVKKGNFIIESH